MCNVGCQSRERTEAVHVPPFIHVSDDVPQKIDIVKSQQGRSDQAPRGVMDCPSKIYSRDQEFLRIAMDLLSVLFLQQP